MDLILYAIPVFLLLILLELAWGLLRGRNSYRLNDTINSLSLGSLSRLQALVVVGVTGLVYESLNGALGLRQLPADRAWVWLSCFLLYDLAYYWKHRLGHEVALFWGSHVAHHQSEDFNLGTALRQTSIDFHGFLFYLPLFLLGYPLEVVLGVASLNLIYQFWVHTEHVPKLGVLEWLLVTPSNHRVHHARNRIYVDRNYGGVFIVWDRLFGSFQEELDEEPVRFGLRKPLNSWNPLWANLHVYWHLLRDVWRAPGFGSKLQLLFRPPGWQPEGARSHCKLRAREPDLESRFDPPLSPFMAGWVSVQFLLSIGLSLALLLEGGTLPLSLRALAVAFLAFSFYCHGACLEGRVWARALEGIRLAALLLTIVLLQVFSIAVLPTLLFAGAVSLLGLSLLALFLQPRLALAALPALDPGGQGSQA